METIKSKFLDLKKRYPDWSSYTCYAVAIMYQ